ncbi:exopolysaccharide biosynthesis predicted pyruvyl transferase EpsI [Ruminiclostridium sufflavum DSM 19573]|uniref:Exopolysaccharide biosynthesis predicted pyruvyl transferase EpsI n=1 Tax=Ruminiclostridium sufflavum DSM 19573 TaxID=1121337 RepID=A0A318XJ53_9FIRM|nr:polysaccharide pyruvyl transferase family protein [Ruminiclostridium sufflavum]PYG86556.1 exopolysaccharide biosynthesis predicted pyruvyl transferase EpsI [Ruminiclostridium sufflavum DSM 19573]
MISEIKRKIRKHEKLCKVAKCIYRLLFKVKNYPKELKKSHIAIERVRAIQKDASKKRIWYMCVPDHSNLGDQAQAFCIRKWFNTYYSDFEVVELMTTSINANRFNLLDEIAEKIKSADKIFFQSGYTSTDTNRDEIAHRMIVKQFENNHIIFFPQTVRYSCEKEMRITSDIYNKHKNITVMARDKVSYETAKEMLTSAEVLLYPDIVTSLIGKYSFNNKRSGILFCMRNDSEQYYEKAQIEALRKRLCAISPTDLTDTTIKMSYKELSTEFKRVLEDTFDKFSQYKLVITDRYHGTIFTLIAQTPVIVVNSTDHKLSSGVDWFKGVYDDYVYFAGTLEEAYEIACKLIKKEYHYHIEDYFDKNYYQKLYSLLEKGG